MAEQRKALFDIEKITNNYQLLGAFLLTAEVLLGVWFGLAADPTERIVAGVLMTAVLLAFLATLVLMSKLQHQSAKPAGLEDIAKESATRDEMEQPSADVLVAPDRTYMIDRPPANWKVKEMSFYEWAASNIGVEDEGLKQKVIDNIPLSSLVTNYPDEKNILVVQSAKKQDVIPFPGKTKINGRLAPSALEVDITSRLVIIPIDRAQPPFYVERPLIHNFVTFTGQISVFGVILLRSMTAGTIAKSHAVYTAEFAQTIENALVNGREAQSIQYNLIAIGIEGEVRDYIMMLYYASPLDAGAKQEQEDVATLRRLANSFRPLGVTDPDEVRHELGKIADDSFKMIIEKRGEQMFIHELAVVLMRLNTMDLNDFEQRNRAIKQLKPFAEFARLTNSEDASLDQLWESLAEAERGNAEPFKQVMAEALKEFKEAALSAESPAGDDAEPSALPKHG